MKNKLLFSIGIALVLVSVIVLAVIGSSTASSSGVTLYADDTQLDGQYYDVDNSTYTVLMCGGFSSDRAMMRPLANMFVQSGLSVMTFDYSGHGSSGGTVGFDNATNGQITAEIAIAIEYLTDTKDISPSNIILLGHSMGGRCILEYMMTSSDTFAHIVLLSPQINYDDNVQSSLFTGVTDSDIEPWASMDGSMLLSTPVTLIGSNSDDIVSSQSMQAIYTRLSTNNDAVVSIDMVDGVFHSYMTYSPSVANSISTNVPFVTGSGSYLVVMVLAWFVAIAGFIMALLCLYRQVPEGNTNVCPIQLDNYSKFIKTKLFLWLPALLVMVIIACIAVVMPFGAPIMSIAFIGGIAGYGIISLIVHNRGKMKGVVGRICKLPSSNKIPLKNILISLAVFFAVLLPLIYILSSGLYNLYPLNFRLFWLVFATAVMSIGFYVGRTEGVMLQGVGAAKLVLYNSTQYMLLFLMGIAYLAMGSFSGLIGLAQNLLLLYICIFAGNVVAKLTNNVWGSICSAFLFQTTMLTATCLMVVF